MSDGIEETLGEHVAVLRQSTLVNAAAVAQRQNEVAQESARRVEEAARRKQENQDGWDKNCVLHALKFATSIAGGKDRTCEQVMLDAEKLLDWLRSNGQQKASSE